MVQETMGNSTSNRGEIKTPGKWYQRFIAYLWYDIMYALYIASIALFKEIFTRPPVLHVENMKKRTGQVVVITGGPRGLALGLIKRLVQLDYTIIMGVRNLEDSQKRLDEYARANPELTFEKITFYKMDLKSLKSIRKFAITVLANVSRIDLLLCNAAIMNAPYELTEDGFESQFQVNYLSNFLLTYLLHDQMKLTAAAKSSPCQIIYTSSVVYSFGKFNFNEIENKISLYTPMKCYYPSKLYQVTAMLAWEKKLRDEYAMVHCYAVHPGLVPTDLWEDVGGRFAGIVCGRIAKRLFRTLENAADTILYPAFCVDFKDNGGHYMESGSAMKICRAAENENNQKKLFDKSIEIIQN